MPDPYASITEVEPEVLEILINALEIPLAIVFGSPAPNKVMAWNVSIIPITVPRRPVKGATTEMTWISVMLRVNFGVSPKIASPSLSSKK